MELSKGDIDRIRGESAEKPGLLKSWSGSTDLELEATFGQEGVVDIQTFLNVINYLQKVRKLRCDAPQEYLTISVQHPVREGVKDVLQRFRFTVNGSINVQRYCQTNKLEEGEYTFEQKQSQQKLDLKEYGVRLKTAVETMKYDSLITEAPSSKLLESILTKWRQYEKYFRVIKRWSFTDEKRGVRFDLSMVRSTKDTPKGKEGPKKFKDQPILEHAPRYEIEVEMLNTERGKPIDELYKNLMLSVVDVLRAIQGSTQLIRESEKVKVVEEYYKVTNDFQPKDKKQPTIVDAKRKGFIGVNPVTLKLENIEKERIRGEVNIRSVKEKGKEDTYYNVTDKADGLRCFGYTSETGEFYLIDMSMNVYKTGLQNPDGKQSLVDGEFITKGNHNPEAKIQFDCLYVFDYYLGPGGNKAIHQLPFYKKTKDGEQDCRYTRLQLWAKNLNDSNVGAKQKFAVQLKTFQFASGVDAPNDIFSKARGIWDTRDSKPYHTDGLIFTPNAASLPDPSKKTRWSEQFKWKPSDENTIDFLVTFENSPSGGTTFNNEFKTNGMFVDCKHLKLYVMSDKYQNLRKEYLESKSLEFIKAHGYRPVVFNPMDPPDIHASVCRVECTKEDDGFYKDYIQCEVSKEIIYNNTVVEMAYDRERPQGWRWWPMRVRQDKTERFRRALATRKPMNRVMNDAGTANDVWNSIHNPITPEMIRTGEITKEEIVKTAYYVRTAETERKQRDKSDTPMRDFHKKFIKADILFNAIRIHFDTLRKATPDAYVSTTLLDLACGIGGDVVRYFKTNPSVVLGIDKSVNNILNPEYSAYTFFLRELEKMTPEDAEAAPPMFFVLGDSSEDIQSGKAAEIEGTAPEQSAVDTLILQSLFGTQTEENPYIRVRENQGSFKKGADAIVLMFALHYFFGSQDAFDGLVSNINKILKVGGLFVGCNFDGKAVREFMKDHKKRTGEVEVGKSKKTLWTIEKQYESKDESDPFGQQIDVMVKSISDDSMPEYLVEWNFFVSAMKKIGCELLSPEEAAKLELPDGDSSQMFEKTYKSITKEKPELSKPLEQYSFLNRWWVFQRKNIIEIVETKGEAEVPLPEGVKEVQITDVQTVQPGPQVGIPAASTTKEIWNVIDSTTLAVSQKRAISGAESPFATPADVPADFNTLLSPMGAFTYTYSHEDGQEQYPCFYYYYYARKLNESGATQAVKDLRKEFSIVGTKGKELYRKLTSTIATPTSKLKDIGTASLNISKMIRSIPTTDFTVWDPSPAVYDALKERFTDTNQVLANKVLCFMSKKYNFKYSTTIEPAIGMDKSTGTNLYGNVLNRVAEELCGGAV